MKRAPRQKVDADQREYTDRKTKERRIIVGLSRRGVGKTIKNRLARARRRAPVKGDA